MHIACGCGVWELEILKWPFTRLIEKMQLGCTMGDVIHRVWNKLVTKNISSLIDFSQVLQLNGCAIRNHLFNFLSTDTLPNLCLFNYSVTFEKRNWRESESKRVNLSPSMFIMLPLSKELNPELLPWLGPYHSSLSLIEMWWSEAGCCRRRQQNINNTETGVGIKDVCLAFDRSHSDLVSSNMAD